MRTFIAFFPEVLALVAALALIFDRPAGLRRYAWLPSASAALLVAALIWELWGGTAVRTFLHGYVEQDRLGLFAKPVLLATGALLLLTGDWPGGRRRTAGLLILGLVAAMGVADATNLPELGLAVLAGTLLALGPGIAELGRPGADPGRLVAAALLVAALVGLALLGVAAKGGGLAAVGRLHPPLHLLPSLAAVLALGGLAGLVALAVRYTTGGGAVLAAVAGVALVKTAGAVLALSGAWSLAFALLAGVLLVASLVVGLGEREGHRLLGAAGLQQAGWLVAAVAVGDERALGAVLFLLAPFLAAMAAGGPALGLLRHGLAGLAERSPARAAAFAAALLSLAGIPPLAGFFGEFLVGGAVSRAGYLWLAGLGLLAGVGVAASVVRALRMAYLTAPGEHLPRPEPHRAPAFTGAVLLALALTLYGIFAYPISSLAYQGARAAGLPLG